jgi:6-pyruvoyltetrahydropterin/6-carboxytetrahydropterin synthase
MRVHLTRRYGFAASHRLHNPALTAEENRQVYGKCNNAFGHGHNYALEVTVSGPVDGRTGMVCDLGELDAAVAREVLEPMDHQLLNTLPELAGQVPSTEFLARYIYERLRATFTAARVERVRLEETAQNSAEYAGERDGEPCRPGGGAERPGSEE